MRALSAVALVLLCLEPIRAQDKPPPTVRPFVMPAASEMMEIDGSKHPELIPQWSAWGFAFRAIAGGPRELPTTVHNLVSPEEAALIRREADAVQKFDQRCAERMLSMTKQLGIEKRSTLEAKARALTLECRWATLHARDGVLQGINPEAGVALTAYVESTKVGTSISLPKKALARYLEPQ